MVYACINRVEFEVDRILWGGGRRVNPDDDLGTWSGFRRFDRGDDGIARAEATIGIDDAHVVVRVGWNTHLVDF